MAEDRLAPPLSATSMLSPSQTIPEEQVINGFHTFLQTALAQAKAERLLDADTLASAESDLMISGPALSLFFGALRSTTDPPSVPIPRSRRDRTAPPIYLSRTNCPLPFVPFFQVWASNVPTIRALAPDDQHDLARVICGLEPLSQPVHPKIGRISADLRAVAIEISQRRTFQLRYQTDLQAAIDAGQIGRGSGRSSGSSLTSHFVPPPEYEEKDTGSSAGSRTPEPESPRPQPPPSPRPAPAAAAAVATDPALALIRETLYASLADVIANSPSLRRALERDPPRAYFSSVGLAILNVALTSTTPSGAVRGVLGRELTLEECPAPLRPLMQELGNLGREAKRWEEEDDEDAVRLAARGKRIPEPRMDRIRKVLESGIGYDERERSRSADENGRRSTEGRAVQFTNRVNVLALRMTELPAFKSYAKDLFEVLGAVS